MKRKVLQEGTHERIESLADKVESALDTENDIKVIMTVLMSNLQRCIECSFDSLVTRKMVLDIMSKPIEEHMGK